MSYNNVALAVIPSGVKADTVYSLIGGDMDFTRSSSATRRNKDGLIEYVDTDIPRLDYDGAIPHLLLEPQRSNAQVYSEDLSNAAWSKTNATITTNAEIAPDGNSTANKFDAGTVTGEHHVNDVNTTVAGINYTFSVFVKSGNEDTIRVFMYRSGTPFTTIAALRINLNTQAIIENVNTAGTENKVENYGDGWYRISISGEALTTSTVVRVQPYESGLGTFTGTNEYFYLWGAQFEEGSYATSYIPNLATGSTTRNAETCLDATGDFNSSEGVLFAEIAPLSDDGTYRVLSISDGTANNRVSLYFTLASETVTGAVFLSGSPVAAMSFNLTTDFFDFNKIAIKFKENDFALWVNGVEVETDISGSTFTNGTLTYFDFSNGVTGNPFYGKVRQAVVFNSVLTDTQLAELTR